MSTEKKSVQGSESETSTTEQKPVMAVVCVACEKEFSADEDHIWLVPLRAIEAAIRKDEGFERWARPEDLKEHAMCGKCGHLVRESGGKTYRLSATLKMVVERKEAAEAKREEQMEADAKAARQAAMAKLEDIYSLALKVGQERRKDGTFGGKKPNGVQVDRKGGNKGKGRRGDQRDEADDGRDE